MSSTTETNNNSAAELTAALGTLQGAAALPGDGLPTPGAPGVVNIDEMDDDVGAKQGDIGNFGMTDDLTPTLQGNIDGGEGLVLRVYANTELLGTVVVDDSGNWTFTPEGLESGSRYTFEVLLPDPLSSEIMVSQPYTIITTGADQDAGASAPKIDGVWDDVGPQQGPVFNGGTTDDNTPTVFGTAGAGEVVTIYDNGTAIGSVTADDHGNWVFTPDTALADGEHAITATAQDTDGNQSPATDPIVFNVATAATTTVIVSDTLQHVFDNSTYIGDGFEVTANTMMTHGGTGSTRVPGLNIANSDTTENYQQITFSNPATAVSFNLSGLENNYGGSRVVITDTNGNVIYDQMVTADGDPATVQGDYHDFSFTAPDGTIIGSVQIYGDHTDGGNQLGGIVLSSLQYQYDRPYDAASDRGAHVIHQDYEALQYNPEGNDYSGSNFNFTITSNAELTHVAANSTSFDGLWLPNSGTAGIDNYLQINLNAPATEVDFRLSGLQNDNGGCHVIITATDGSVLYDQMVTADGDPSVASGDYANFSFSAPDGQTIASVQVYGDNANSGTTLDSLHFTYAGDNQPQPLMSTDAFVAESHSADVEQLAQSAALGVEQNVAATLPGDGLPTPGAPGVVNIDEMDDDVGAKQGDIGHYGLTDDLTPTLQGNIDGGEGLVLRVYANTEFLGTVVVDDSGNWTFTPEGLESGSKYTFEVLLPDPLSSEIMISQPYTIITTGADQDVASAAPEISGLWDDAGPQQGPIFGGDTTDDNTPTVFGTAGAGEVVTIYDNGTAIGSVTADDHGNWVFTPETPLADGEHSLTATTPDTDGNPGAPSAAVDFIVDTGGQTPTGPEAATDLALTDDVGPVTGPIVNGDTTDDAQPILSGKAAPDDTVIISDNGNVIGSAVVDGDGNWSFTPATPLDDGAHSFSTVVQDAAGNQSPATDPIAFNVATTTTVIVSDTLQHAVENNTYAGDGFEVTANTMLTRQEANYTRYPGLNIANSDTDENYQQITFTNPATAFSLDISGLQNNYGGSRVVITDSDGNVLYDQMVTADGNPGEINGDYHHFSFTAPAGATIGNVQIYGDHTDGGNQLGGIVLSSLQYQYDRPYDAAIDRGAHVIHQDYEALQYHPSDSTYSGDNFNFTITSNAELTHTAANSTSFDGLWLPNSTDSGVDNYLQINLNAPATEVDFRLSGLQNDDGGSHVIITATDGSVLYDQMVTADGDPSVAGGDYANFSFSAPDGQSIASVQVYGDHANSGTTLDSLHFTYAGDDQPQPLVSTDAFAAEIHSADAEQLAQGAVNIAETVNLTNGAHDALHLTAEDVLNHGQQNLVFQDGTTQLAVNGDAGDVVELHVADASQQWHDAGQNTIGGNSWEIYQNSAGTAELLMQPGVELHQIYG